MFTGLETAQAVLDKKGQVSLVEVAALCEACPIDEMVAQISDALPAAQVMAIQQVVKGRMQTLSQVKQFAYGISVVIVLIGSLVVLVTMMGSVRERTDEIGIFRAVGFRRRQVMRIIFLEAGLVSALAGAAGYLVGYGGVMIVFTAIRGAANTVAFNPHLAAGALLLALTMGLLSSVYPAWMAARLDPSQALKHL
jgi:putative ABC transport system permease protein